MNKFKVGDRIIEKGISMNGTPFTHIGTITESFWDKASRRPYYSVIFDIGWKAYHMQETRLELINTISNENTKLSPHEGHEIVTSIVMNKEFQYCIDCEVEIL